MPRIFDNIDNQLLPALGNTLRDAYRADFCVGYFNLRGWKSIDSFLEDRDPNRGASVRLLAGCSVRPRTSCGRGSASRPTTGWTIRR